MFDAGVNWIRIGQYENSTDYTSWDWVERRRGVYSVAPKVDDYIDSLVDNGVNIQVQLLYGNPLYTSIAGRLPQLITPAPGSFHSPDRSLYSVLWPPKTAEQITAFTDYVRWMVEHFRGRIHYYALWNEEDDEFWNPRPDPVEYARLLHAFIPAVHAADPQAKVIFGGLGGTERDFAERALAACQCAQQLDVFAYHVYPNYGHNLNPEALDEPGHEHESPRLLRELVRRMGARPDLVFWNDESNSIPSWIGSDESVQVKYIPRDLIYDRAAGVRTFIWELTPGVDGNEADDFGMIRGMMLRPTDFTPRPAFYSMQNTIALFSDTRLDPSIEIHAGSLPQGSASHWIAYGFRAQTSRPAGKAIAPFWWAIRSQPGNTFQPLSATLTIRNSGIRNPVLIDVDSGAVRPLSWKPGTTDTLENVPVLDSVQAIADAEYFDWPVLPETPSALKLRTNGEGSDPQWSVNDSTTAIAVERRIGHASWTRIARLPASATTYHDGSSPVSGPVKYRVRAFNRDGESAYSNVVVRR